MSRLATEQRLADALASEVATRVALRFRGLRDGEPTRLVAPVATPPAMPETLPPRGVLLPGPEGRLGGPLGGSLGPGGTAAP